MDNKYLIGSIAVVGLGVYFFTRKPKQENIDAKNEVIEPQPNSNEMVKPTVKPTVKPKPLTLTTPIDDINATQNRQSFSMGTVEILPKTSYLDKDESSKLALETVTNTMKLFEAIPKESLTEISKFYLQEEDRIKQLEINKISYQDAKNLAKSNRKPKFFFRGETWYVVDDTNVKDWQVQPTPVTSNSLDFFNFLAKRGKRINGGDTNPYVINYVLANVPSAISSVITKLPTTKFLQDYVNIFKNENFATLFNSLKKIYQIIPKEDAIRFANIVPFIVFTQNLQFDFTKNYFDMNQLSLEDKLFLLDKKYKTTKDFFALTDLFETLVAKKGGFEDYDVVSNRLILRIGSPTFRLNAFFSRPSFLGGRAFANLNAMKFI